MNFRIELVIQFKCLTTFLFPFSANGDGTHIACVTYGTRAKTEFTFNEAAVQTKEKALKKIDKIIYTSTYFQIGFHLFPSTKLTLCNFPHFRR